LTILILNTIYQVTPDPRPFPLTLTFNLVKKLYVPVVDAVIAFSMLWFFYSQGLRSNEYEVS
jgi:hypothetical protein